MSGFSRTGNREQLRRIDRPSPPGFSARDDQYELVEYACHEGNYVRVANS